MIPQTITAKNSESAYIEMKPQTDNAVSVTYCQGSHPHRHFKIHFENTPWCFIFKNKYVIFPSLREMIQWPQIRAVFGVFQGSNFISEGYFTCITTVVTCPEYGGCLLAAHGRNGEFWWCGLRVKCATEEW